jgi:hypothetical protein
MTTLVQKLLDVHGTLNEAGIPHAFGGAIALAYCTQEPRATIDLDINIFLPTPSYEEALAALPAAVTTTAHNIAEISSAGQTRVRWDETPLDLFFANHPFHEIARTRVRTVPFAGTTIPVLDCTTLAVFKTFFNRTKDWADLEAMAAAGALEVDAVSAFVEGLLGPGDERLVRLRQLA